MNAIRLTARDIFTVIPAVDPYNGRRLDGFRIVGYCEHLSCGAGNVVYKNAEDAEAWIDAHEQFHR